MVEELKPVNSEAFFKSRVSEEVSAISLARSSNAFFTASSMSVETVFFRRASNSPMENCQIGFELKLLLYIMQISETFFNIQQPR